MRNLTAAQKRKLHSLAIKIQQLTDKAYAVMGDDPETGDAWTALNCCASAAGEIEILTADLNHATKEG